MKTISAQMTDSDLQIKTQIKNMTSAIITSRVIDIGNSIIYIGGNFTSKGRLSRSRIAKLNTSANLADATWNLIANNTVESIAVSFSDVYVGIFLSKMNGGDSQVNFALFTDRAMPVELTTFTDMVNGTDVELNWQSATEVNNNGFEIEHSDISGQLSEWKTIGFIEGHGNSNSPKDYTFTDASASLSTSAFKNRLKQIDSDGKYKYLDVAEVKIENLPKEFVLNQNYPNPFNSYTFINYQSNNKGKIL